MLLPKPRNSRTLALQQLAVLRESEERMHLDALLAICTEGSILIDLAFCFDAATFFWVVYHPDRWDLRADIPFDWCPLFKDTFQKEGLLEQAFTAYRQIRLDDIALAAETLSAAV